MKIRHLKLIIALVVFVSFNTAIYAQETVKYIVSGWVKEIHSDQQTTYLNSSINVNYLSIIDEGGGSYSIGAEVNNVFRPSGRIIDGWQRIIGVIEIPELSERAINIILSADDPSIDCYFDDVRIFPYNGSMKSFVYDEDTQRLVAELDENNYATFYEYDSEGGLVRVKKETEKGIYTIQETRSGNPTE